MKNEKLQQSIFEDPLSQKSFSFGLRIIKLYLYLKTEHKEFVLSKQILRSGTSIRAMIQESHFAQSKADFINKLSVALKEANETRYWLYLLAESNFIQPHMLKSILPDIEDLIKMLVSSTKTAKQNNAK
ncbi:MAG: four helix bundle protein [Sulfurovum sp.]|nr:four helix bundle protein [Sulfurovum sp.]MDD3601853.1 four helix bundle protein [Sulfurovum sp.]